MKTLSIIGAGKAGSTIAKLISDHKLLRVNQILNSSPASSTSAAKFIGAGSAVESFKDLRPADLWLIGTSDQQIENAAKQLVGSNVISPGNIAFHLSGIVSSTGLNPLKQQGALIAAVHPLFSFADPTIAVKNYLGVFCGIEGDLAATNLLSELFSGIDSIPFLIDAQKKSLYHSAAVFSSNYIVTLLNCAEKILIESGTDSEMARSIACSLARQVVQNVETLGTKDALTGPLKRNDEATVEKHQLALHGFDGELEKLYTQLASVTKRDLL